MAKGVPKVVLFRDDGAGERGTLAVAEFNAVATKFGLPWVARCQPRDADAGTAALVIAFGSPAAEQLPVAEVWDVAPGPGAKPAIDQHVSGLVARLLGGRVVADDPIPSASTTSKPPPPKKVHTVRVGRETAGRRGKGVTTVFDLPLTEDGMKELAATLKQKCGTGGTVKDGRIEIQGDQREKIVAELEKIGYKVKRTGG